MKCVDCGITLDKGDEEEDGRCSQCQAVKDEEDNINTVINN